MKKLLFTATLLLSVLAVSADDYEYKYLAFVDGNGNEQTVSVENLQITFSEGELTAVNADGTTLFTLADLSKMYFTATPTGIEDVYSQDGQESLAVYTATGIYVGRYASLDKAKAALSPGLYVLKTDNKTIKLALK